MAHGGFVGSLVTVVSGLTDSQYLGSQFESHLNSKTSKPTDSYSNKIAPNVAKSAPIAAKKSSLCGCF